MSFYPPMWKIASPPLLIQSCKVHSSLLPFHTCTSILRQWETRLLLFTYFLIFFLLPEKWEERCFEDCHLELPVLSSTVTALVSQISFCTHCCRVDFFLLLEVSWDPSEAFLAPGLVLSLLFSLSGLALCEGFLQELEREIQESRCCFFYL